MSHSIVQVNGWNTITPADMAAGTPSKAINDNFLALANIVSTTATLPNIIVQTRAPGGSDDSANTSGAGVCKVGTLWLNTTLRLASICEVSTPTHASWSTLNNTPNLTNVLLQGTNASGHAITNLGGLATGGTTSLDNGQITTDGEGDLTIAGCSSGGDFPYALVVGTGNAGGTSLDNGAITTDGSGGLMATSVMLPNFATIHADDSNVAINTGFEVAGSLYVSGSLYVGATETSLDNGAITTDGSGGLTVQSLLYTGGPVEHYNLPTSDPGVPNRLWNSGGFLKVSAG